MNENTIQQQLICVADSIDQLTTQYDKTMRRIYLWVIDLAYKRLKAFKSITPPDTRELEKITPQKAQMLELRCGKNGLVSLANERCQIMFELKNLRKQRDELIAQIKN